MSQYEVNVGNIGTVYEGTNALMARQMYDYYSSQAFDDAGRAEFPVVLMRDEEVDAENDLSKMLQHDLAVRLTRLLVDQIDFFFRQRGMDVHPNVQQHYEAEFHVTATTSALARNVASMLVMMYEDW